jgi:hypothetical protein
LSRASTFAPTDANARTTGARPTCAA